MEIHVETLITSTARSKLPECIYNFSKSINFFYNFLNPLVFYSEIFLINNCQCQNEVKNHTVPP
jgi:hypothetical protein